MAAPKDELATSLRQAQQEVADAVEAFKDHERLLGLAKPYGSLNNTEFSEQFRRYEAKLQELMDRALDAQQRLRVLEATAGPQAVSIPEIDPTVIEPDNGLNAPFIDPAAEESLDKLDRGEQARSEAEPRTEPLLTDEEFEKLISRTTGTSSYQGELGDPPERQAHPAHGSQRQAHPAHGQTQRQAHALHGLPKKALLVAGIGMLIVVIGATAVAARPAQQAQAPAPLVETLRPAEATAAPAQASAVPAQPSAAANAGAPVGATLTVAPYYQAIASESCVAVPGSQPEVVNGVAVHVIRLAPKVVTNPPPGESVTYDWGMVRVFTARCGGFSTGLEYERMSGPTTRGFVLFPPSTSYSFVPTQPTSAPGGGRQLSTILTVTNHSR